MNELFNVEKFGVGIRISNNSKMNLIISQVPIKPKRKYIDRFLVKPGTFSILDQEIDMTLISFRFVK